MASTYHLARGVDRSSRYLTPSRANSTMVSFVARVTASGVVVRFWTILKTAKTLSKSIASPSLIKNVGGSIP